MHSYYRIMTAINYCRNVLLPAAEWMIKSGSEISEVEYSLKKQYSFVSFIFLFILPCVGVIDLGIMETKAELPARAPRGNLYKTVRHKIHLCIIPPDLVFIKVDPCSNLKEPISGLLIKFA